METSQDCPACPPVQIIDVATIKIHNDYNGRASAAGNDIALVRLKDLAILFFVRFLIGHLVFHLYYTILCISTRKWVLCMTLACQNHIFSINHLFPSK